MSDPPSVPYNDGEQVSEAGTELTASGLEDEVFCKVASIILSPFLLGYPGGKCGRGNGALRPGVAGMVEGRGSDYSPRRLGNT